MYRKLKAACCSKTHGKAEIIALILYMAGVSLITYFHEPWLDEAQAWQIARCASIREILFEIPHYEGHPQLWHLILAVFAKLGAPYEFSLFLVNFAFCVAAVALLLWKSPFPKVLRCVLPFTYFFFYHYGVISRPYSMMTLAFMLAAITCPERNRKPVRYVLALAFLCATCAYGAVIAGGLCIVWTWEIFTEYRQEQKWNKLLTDRRCYALLGILLFAVFLLVCMIPAEDAFYYGRNQPFLQRLGAFWYLPVMPFDSYIGCCYNENKLYNTPAGIAIGIIAGLLCWAVMILFLHENRKKAFFLVPYLLYCCTSLYLFFLMHHLGVSAMFMVFALWAILAENGTIRIPPVFRKISTKIESAFTRRLAFAVLLLAGMASPFYAVTASVTDIRYAYSAKNIAGFIKENHLEDKKIMVRWSYEEDIQGTSVFDETLPANFPALLENHPWVNPISTVIQPYFEENIIMNFNTDDPGSMYLKWKDDGDCETLYASWRKQGLPDFIIGLVPLQEIYSEEELEGVTYCWIDTMKYGGIWKLTREEVVTKIYIRSDLLDEYPQFRTITYATFTDS